jgi:uncharacterized protein
MQPTVSFTRIHNIQVISLANSNGYRIFFASETGFCKPGVYGMKKNNSINDLMSITNIAAIRSLVVSKDLKGLHNALSADPSLANAGWPADDKNPALAHPLHRICDGVYSKIYSDEYAIEVAKIFMAHGADINGNVTEIKKDNPLVAAASLDAEQLGIFYVDQGAAINHPGCHGGTALHWAAWCGKDLLLNKLIAAGAQINKLCIDYKSTPVFWAAHGFYHSDRKAHDHYVACVRSLLEAGADKTTTNIDGSPPAEMVQEDEELFQLLKL